nr:hypothetical protein [Tanacetum cinerariifolium]
MLLKRPKENTKCVSAAGEELTAAKHKLKLLTIEENGVTRPKKYSELSATEAIQADCDVKLLMQETSLLKQERECKLYDEFNKFAYKKEESLREFYLRFSLLLNDMNIYNMKLEQFQMNTKFLNTLSSEWSKFVTDVKLVRGLHTKNVDQLHAYLGQHEFHANEVRLMHELQHNVYNPSSSIPQVKYAPSVHQQSDFSQPDSGLIFPMFQKAIQNSNFPTQQDALILSVIEQLKTQVVNYTKINLDNKSVNETLTADLERYKDQLEPKFYDGSVIQKTNAIVIRDSEETLMLEEESCFKMLQKQKDPMMSEKKNSVNSEEPNLSTRPTQVEVPTEIPKVSMVNSSLKKLKYHLASFDVVVKERITATAITEGTERHYVVVPAFWFLRFVSYDLVLRFGHAFCLKTSCVLPKDKLRFVSKQVAFCFKARSVLLQSSLRFASKLVAFCFKTRCVLLQDPCVLSQDSCIMSHGGTAFCLLLKTLSAICESEGIPEHKCDVPFHDNSPPLDTSKDQFEDFFDSNEEFSLTGDDSFSFDKIDYVEASPPDSELFSSKVMEIVIPEVGEIEASNDNPIPFYDPIISGTPPNLTPPGETEYESDSSDDQSCSDEDVL